MDRQSRHKSAGGFRVTANPGGLATVRRSQNQHAAKAAAQRLAQAMASQSNHEEENDVLPSRGTSPPPIKIYAISTASARARSSRSPSPAFGRNLNGNASTTHLTSTVRASTSPRPASRPLSNGASVAQRLSKPLVKATSDVLKETRYLTDLQDVKFQEFDDQYEAAILHDEIDLLREENKKILQKLRLAEDKFKEQQARARDYEKQVAFLGEGLSLEAHMLSEKEAELQQREDALKAEKRAKDVKDVEIEAFCLEVKTLKGEARKRLQQAWEAESKSNSLRLMMERMVLTQEEKEEVVLKRCWLARYWGLAVRHGIFSEIASQKHEYWSSLAPLPLEVVLSAGLKAKEEHLNDNNVLKNDKAGNNGDEEKRRHARNLSDLYGDGNIDSMLSVEKGLHELASLKVEDTIAVAMAQHRQSNLVRRDESLRDKSSLGSTPKFRDSLDLTEEEVEDIQFKQAFLIYFWRRAKTHKVAEDIVDKRLQYWISRINQSPTCRDVVDVQQGLRELQKLGIEDQLWEASRKEIS